MDRIEPLKQDLWARWEREMQRRPSPVEAPPPDGRALYARVPLFDLKEYTPRRFPAGGRASSRPFPGIDNRVYHLDAEGRPIQMTHRHSYNRVNWLGVYSYSADDARYCEWCLQTGVCSEYDRIALQDGVPSSFQRLRINGNGSFPIWKGLRPDSQIQKIRADSHGYQIRVEQYELHDGRVTSGVSFIDGMGLPPTRYELLYSYADGRLERIARRSPSGEEQTVFAARRSASLSALSAELSRRISDKALELLRTAPRGSPLVALELSYRSVETYIPSLIPLTERDETRSLTLAAEVPLERWLPLREEDFAPAITDFHERVRTTEKYEAGTGMLREAARQITNRAKHELQTTDGFVAFAMDWEFEGGELQSILTACGASPETLRVFRARGWI